MTLIEVVWFLSSLPCLPGQAEILKTQICPLEVIDRRFLEVRALIYLSMLFYHCLLYDRSTFDLVLSRMKERIQKFEAYGCTFEF